MSLLARSQLRFLLLVPWSALTALLGVTLGVASVVAVHQISAGVERSLRDTVPPHLAGITHLLQRDELQADVYFDLRRRWRAGEFPGVLALVPVVEGQAVVQGRPAALVGADWLSMTAAGARSTRPAGSTLAAPLPLLRMLADAQVVVSPELGVAEGGWVEIGTDRLTVAGVVPAGIGPAAFVDIGQAHRLLGLEPTALSFVGVSVVDPWRWWRSRLDRLMPGISAALPDPGVPALLAVDWHVRPVRQELPSATFARSILFNLGALSTLALLVAWFLIYQVGVIWLRRQGLLITRLVALGVRPGEFLLGFLPGFALFGLVATILGTAVGQVLSSVLVAATAAGMPGPEPAGMDVWVAGKALLSGVGVCLVGGWAAFLRDAAGSWSGGTPRRRSSWPALGGLLLLAGFGIVVDASGLAGAFLSILALSLLGVLGIRGVLSVCRSVTRGIAGPLLLRIGLREATWHPRVVGVALAALSLAVATSIAIGLMVESFRLDFARMLEIRLAGDLYVRGTPERIAEARRWLEEHPQVLDLRAYGSVRYRVGGEPVDLSFGRYDASETRRYGYEGALDAGEIMISERLSRDLGAGPGDFLSVGPDATTGPPAAGFEVVHVFPGFGDPVPRVLITVAAARGLDLQPVVDRLTLNLAPGAELAAEIGRRFADLEVQSRSGLRGVALRIFDRTFAVTQALTLLALTVAVVGMYSALMALRLIQAPTRRLLLHQGMTQWELRGLALSRALVLGGLALAVAVPLGLAMAWVLCAVVNPRAFGWSVALELPVSGLAPPLLLGLAAALLAGLLPAPREQGDLDDLA